jgi:hypothetical protein
MIALYQMRNAKIVLKKYWKKVKIIETFQGKGGFYLNMQIINKAMVVS